MINPRYWKSDEERIKVKTILYDEYGKFGERNDKE